jgi:Xaa-Pro aminopeptidase
MKKLTGALLLIGGTADGADFRYATGFEAVDPVVYIRHGRTSVLIVPPMEKGRARREAKRGVQVMASNEILPRRSARARLSDWITAYARQRRIKRFVVTARCPVGVVETLRARGFSIRVLTSAPQPARARKKPDEVRRIARAQRAAVAALKAAVAFLAQTRVAKNGALVHRGKVVTAEDVRAVIAMELLRRNCVCEGTIVACGAQSADPHERGHGPLRANTPIVVDIFPRDLRTGYWGDLTRTVVKGRASAGIREMFRAVLAAHHTVLRTARPGMGLARLHRAAQQVLEQHGFATRLEGTPEGFIHGTGHGVGLEIHEAPAIAPVKGVLKHGHVVTIEPGLYYRAHGGVRIEDTVWIGPRGGRVLARAPYRLEI